MRLRKIETRRITQYHLAQHEEMRAALVARRRRRRLILLGILVLCGLAYGTYAFLTRNMVTAQGTVEGNQVHVASTVIGRMAELSFKVGDDVALGDVVARLEDDEARADLERAKKAAEKAEAERDSIASSEPTPFDMGESAAKAEAEMAVAGELRSGAQAEFNRVKAIVEEQKRAVENTEKLFLLEAIPRPQLDAAKATLLEAELDQDVAAKTLREHEARLKGAQERLAIIKTKYPFTEPVSMEEYRASELAVAEKNVEMNKAALLEAQVKLKGLSVVSPVTGKLITYLKQVGEVVTPSDPIALLSDPSEMWATVFVTEPDAVLIKPGQRAVVSSLARPHIKLLGKVSVVGDVAEQLPGLLRDPRRAPRLHQRIRIEFDNMAEAKTLLVPQSFVEATITVEGGNVFRWK